MESLNSKPLQLGSVAGPVTRRRKALLARAQAGGGPPAPEALEDTAATGQRQRQRQQQQQPSRKVGRAPGAGLDAGAPPAAMPLPSSSGLTPFPPPPPPSSQTSHTRTRAQRARPPACGYDVCLFVRWCNIDGRARVSRLPLSPIAGVDGLRGLFRKLIKVGCLFWGGLRGVREECVRVIGGVSAWGRPHAPLLALAHCSTPPATPPTRPSSPRGESRAPSPPMSCRTTWPRLTCTTCSRRQRCGVPALARASTEPLYPPSKKKREKNQKQETTSTPPPQEFVSLPGDAARTEFRLAVTLDGWEHTVAERELGVVRDPERNMLVTVRRRACVCVCLCVCVCEGGGAEHWAPGYRERRPPGAAHLGLSTPLLLPPPPPTPPQVAEFESDAFEVEGQEIILNLVSYPTVCVRREFLDDAVHALAAASARARAPAAPPLSAGA